MDSNTIQVLDNIGYVKLLNISGPTRRPEALYDADDIDPANVARTSFGKMNSGRTREADLKLCDYLVRNRHTSPIEFIEVWLEMKIPIFTARQLVRHRTSSINEISGRYVTLPEEWYIPDIVRGKPIDAKQGSTDSLPIETQDWYKHELNGACKSSYSKYLEAINKGIAAEEARYLLHLNHYTKWVWKQDLHNLMHLLSLRNHTHSQNATVEVAAAIETLVRAQLPDIMAIYDKHRKPNSKKLPTWWSKLEKYLFKD